MNVSIAILINISVMSGTYRSHCLGVAEHDPELEDCKRPHPGHSEKTNPLNAESSAKGNTSCGQPEPPWALEGRRRSQFLLVCEAAEGECSQGSEENEGRVQQDQTRLSGQGVIYAFSQPCFKE
jgi:hypothetical protein